MADLEPYEILRDRVAEYGRFTPRGNAQGSGQCPAHDDRDPSLSIGIGECGMCAVAKCHAGCDIEAILDKLGLALRDLFHPECTTHRRARAGVPGTGWPDRGPRVSRPRPPAATKSQKRDDVPSWWPNLGRPDATYRYCDADGTLVGEVRRYEYHKDGARLAKTFRAFHRGPDGKPTPGKWATPVLYALPLVRGAAATRGTVYLCEGEADADAINAAGGYTATTAPFGAQSEWLPEYTQQLHGATVVIIRDKDAPGQSRAARVYADLTSAGLTVWIAEAAAGKDPRDHFAAGFTMQELVKVDPAAPPTATPVAAAPPDHNPTASAGALEATIRATERPRDVPGWEDPLPLDAARMPAFPVHRLGALQEMTEAVAESYQVPADLPALSGLSVIATAVGGRRVITPRPDWKEASPLWVLVALPSGDRKSPAQDAMTAPLANAESELRAIHGPTISARRQEIRILEDRLGEAEKNAARKTAQADRDSAKADADALRVELDEYGVTPENPQLLGGDTTPEALGLMLAEQDGRIGIHTSEAGLFGTLAGRYSNKVPNLDLTLEGYRGGPYRLKRVTRSAIDLPAIHLSLDLCIQPAILSGLAANKENNFRDTGFLARFLFSMPTSMVGQRAITPASIPDDIRADWHKTVGDIVRHIWDSPEPKTMRLEHKAEDLFLDFCAALEPRLGANGELAPLTDWAAKLAGNLSRVAAMLTLADNPMAMNVTTRRMEDALGMAEYFVTHAWRAFDVMGNDVNARLEPARNALAWLRKRASDLRASGHDPLAPFTVRDANRALHGRAWVKDGGVDAVVAALEDLKDYGWIGEQPPAEDEDRRRGRPPAPGFAVHPWVADPPAVNREPGGAATA